MEVRTVVEHTDGSYEYSDWDESLRDKEELNTRAKKLGLRLTKDVTNVHIIQNGKVKLILLHDIRSIAYEVRE